MRKITVLALLLLALACKPALAQDTSLIEKYTRVMANYITDFDSLASSGVTPNDMARCLMLKKDATVILLWLTFIKDFRDLLKTVNNPQARDAILLKYREKVRMLIDICILTVESINFELPKMANQAAIATAIKFKDDLREMQRKMESESRGL